MSEARSEILRRAAREHRRLLQRARNTPPDEIAALLSIGTAVVMHGLLEDTELGISRYLDDGARQRAAADHGRLAADLRLLEELWWSGAEGDDLYELAGAVHGRMLRHLERDQRTIYGVVRRLEESRDAYDERHRSPPGESLA